jgi:hypothetical protein
VALAFEPTPNLATLAFTVSVMAVSELLWAATGIETLAIKSTLANKQIKWGFILVIPFLLATQTVQLTSVPGFRWSSDEKCNENANRCAANITRPAG